MRLLVLLTRYRLAYSRHQIRSSDARELFIKQSVFLHSVLLFLVTANVALISPILVTLMMEVILSSETPVLTRATRRNISEDCFL
jgi:Na+/H+ antiporter NhaD/arsenite permease-like protein